VGRIQNSRQEIVSGLRPGELVVVNGQSRLSDGAAVVIQIPAEARK
jgi:multidrug efflux pump subunit AcrA (membrane-fusion protein)